MQVPAHKTTSEFKRKTQNPKASLFSNTTLTSSGLHYTHLRTERRSFKLGSCRALIITVKRLSIKCTKFCGINSL